MQAETVKYQMKSIIKHTGGYAVKVFRTTRLITVTSKTTEMT